LLALELLRKIGAEIQVREKKRRNLRKTLPAQARGDSGNEMTASVAWRQRTKNERLLPIIVTLGDNNWQHDLFILEFCFVVLIPF